MNPATLQSLLRRTAVALTAAAASFIALPAGALTMALPGGVACNTPTITTQPDGSLALTCNGGTTTVGGPDTFTLSAPASLQTGSSGSATITRSGTASTATVVITWNASGACTGGGQVSFAPATTSAPLPLTAAATAGTCAVSIDFAAGSTGTIAGNPASITVSAPSSTGTTTGTSGTGGLPYNVTSTINAATYVPGLNGAAVPIVPGCPAPDPSTRMGNLPLPNGLYINPLTAGSTVVTSFPLYGLGQFGRQSAGVNFGETPLSYSPAPYAADISISPCPGVIPATYDLRAYCDRRGAAANNGFSLGWVNSASAPTAYFSCVAPETTQYYYNVRWTYAPGTCAQGQSTCGFSVNTN